MSIWTAVKTFTSTILTAPDMNTYVSDNTNYLKDQVDARSLYRLRVANGTDTNAAATNVDTVAISGLTAKDVLLVWTELFTVTQPTAQCKLYNATDGIELCKCSQSPLNSGGFPACMGDAILWQSQNSATSIFAQFEGMQSTATRFDDAGFGVAVTQAWTGSWTLALRHGGVTAGGTLRWAWHVHKLMGQ
jgi:hypothetical protein